MRSMEGSREDVQSDSCFCTYLSPLTAGGWAVKEDHSHSVQVSVFSREVG